MTLPGWHNAPTWGTTAAFQWQMEGCWDRGAGLDYCRLTEQPLDQPVCQQANMSLCWLHLCLVSNIMVWLDRLPKGDFYSTIILHQCLCLGLVTWCVTCAQLWLLFMCISSMVPRTIKPPSWRKKEDEGTDSRKYWDDTLSFYGLKDWIQLIIFKTFTDLHHSIVPSLTAGLSPFFWAVQFKFTLWVHYTFIGGISPSTRTFIRGLKATKQPSSHLYSRACYICSVKHY